MLDGFAGGVAVRFERKHYESCRTAVAADGGEQALRLHRICALVVVSLAVDQQDRFVDLVGVKERRHFRIQIWGFPERAAFGLEAERRECPVVRAASRDSRPE